MRDAKGKYTKGSETRRKTSIETNCKLCGKSFLVQPHRFKSNRGQFCSLVCKRSFGMTKEAKDKMSKSRKGKPVPARQGENCHFWKGGITPINKKIRMSLEMRLWREAVFKRDDWTCVWCGQKGGRLQADHIKRFADYPALRFAIDNGRTLCVSCHKLTDTYGR